MRRARYLFAGTVETIIAGLDELVETANPEWFAWLFDQGLLPRTELRKQLELFGAHILPRYQPINSARSRTRV
jgi:hypothetical protein